jgi:predicted anti-sigma-YlaC factor YlaD
MLSSTQSQLLHAHLATCPECRAQWTAMTMVSQMLHAAPTIGPLPGFTVRFEARLAYRLEQRRQALIWILLGIGVVALVILALPSILGLLGLAGRLVLPYQTLVRLEELFQWAYILLSTLVDAARVLLRHFVATPAGIACIGVAIVAVPLSLIGTRLVAKRLVTSRTA